MEGARPRGCAPGKSVGALEREEAREVTFPELDTRSVLRALDPDANVLGVASTPWREWVAGLPEVRALGYAAALATEFRSTPDLKPDFTGNDLLTRHLLWIGSRRGFKRTSRAG